MKEIRQTHQLRLLVFPIIYRVSYIPGGAGFLPSSVYLIVSMLCNAPSYMVNMKCLAYSTGGTPPPLKKNKTCFRTLKMHFSVHPKTTLSTLHLTKEESMAHM